MTRKSENSARFLLIKMCNKTTRGRGDWYDLGSGIPSMSHPWERWRCPVTWGVRPCHVGGLPLSRGGSAPVTWGVCPLHLGGPPLPPGGSAPAMWGCLLLPHWGSAPATGGPPLPRGRSAPGSGAFSLSLFIRESPSTSVKRGRGDTATTQRWASQPPWDM